MPSMMESNTDITSVTSVSAVSTDATDVTHATDATHATDVTKATNATHATNDRPSFVNIFMNLARQLAERSTCQRLKVGTVITSTDFRKVLSLGYNGNACGLPNACESNVPGLCLCIHSEANAIINCDIPRHVEKIVFVTHSPCKMCAKYLINLGNVKKVYYNSAYRITEPVDLLKRVGIEVEQI